MAHLPVLPTRVDIKVSEALAALVALELLALVDGRQDSIVEIFVDNMVIKYFLNKGTCRWHEVPYATQVVLLLRRAKLTQRFIIKAHYIPTDANPADWLSRSDPLFLKGQSFCKGRICPLATKDPDFWNSE